MSRRPTSSLAACVWIPLFPLRCEEARHEGLAAYPTALLAPDTTRKLWQVSSLARHVGVKPGMTVSQAIGLCPTLRLIEPDPIHYDERFAHLLSALSEVSPVVEPGELGLAYVGADGLEGIYGSPLTIIEAIRQSVRPSDRSTVRLGWGVGKFTAWVAASRARPSEAIVLPAGAEQKFLAPQPIAVLPLDSTAMGWGARNFCSAPAGKTIASLGLARLAATQAVNFPTPQPSRTVERSDGRTD